MLTELCSAHCLLPCPVNLNRSVGGRLMEVVEVSMAKTTQLDSHCYLLLSPAPIFSFFFPPLFVCMCVCLCVCACFLQVWKSQHQTSTSQSLWAGERRSCQDVQHQKVSTMSLLIYSYPHIKKTKTTTKKTYWNLMAFLKWLLLIMADISGQPRSTNDFEREKALMWRKVMVDFRSQHRTNFITCKVSKSYDLRHICPYTVLNWYF